MEAKNSLTTRLIIAMTDLPRLKHVSEDKTATSVATELPLAPLVPATYKKSHCQTLNQIIAALCKKQNALLQALNAS
jgi:hypothetical protein